MIFDETAYCLFLQDEIPPRSNESCSEDFCSAEGSPRQGDLHGAASGGYGHCPEGVPVEFALLSLLAAFGVAFGILYRALTLTTGGRKKRNSSNFLIFHTALADLFWSGKS